MKLPQISEIAVRGKTVLVRAAFDVPMSEGQICDDSRIRDCLPTLRTLLEKNAKIVIISKLGRPEGWDSSFSLEPAAMKLAEILGRKFIALDEGATSLPEYSIPHLYFFKHNIEKSSPKQLISQMREKDIAVLENLLFYDKEKENNSDFARLLAGCADVYVNEAFASCHRTEASIARIPEFLPSAAGLGLVREIASLERILNHPKKPVVVMMGGVKLSTKAPALENLAKFADEVLLGGGLANLFLKARGYEIGRSVWEKQQETLARKILRDHREKIKLPLDVVVSNSDMEMVEVVKISEVKPHHMILDIGPATIGEYSGYLKKGKTLIWNGPMGYFEKKPFSHGTYSLARLFASRTGREVYGVAGGGETLEAIHNLGMEKYIDHVSTGGGAMLDFLAGKELPGLKALMKTE
ncbi:phosphoglycerate kinase [bacterium]|nr:MAG: phosphoglycerate kinase [bacterium]